MVTGGWILTGVLPPAAPPRIRTIQKERLKAILDGLISGPFPKAKKEQAIILMEKLR
ncbi:MAG: hypothetical protein JNM22_04550 [Saprospiraceae bacterium]|nr:hypothetical protein [Saprospiraceae bacterium]